MCSFPVQGLCKARLSVLRRLKLGWCWRGGAGWKSVPGKADLSLGLLERAHSMAACDPSARSGSVFNSSLPLPKDSSAQI